ncbi:MAG: Fic family protein [Bacillota bacterium]
MNKNYIFNKETFPLKKKLTEIIYNAARIEIDNITFLETEKIVKNISTCGKSPVEIQVVLNLKHASEYILTTNDTGLKLLKKINKRVSYQESLEWGVLRNGLVGVSGVDNKIPIPKAEEIESIISSDLDHYNKMLELIVRQPFWDGNKRTAYLYTLLENFRDNGEILTLNLEKFSENLHEKYLNLYDK